VAVSAVVGFIFLFALTTHLPNLSTLFPAELNDSTLPASSQYYFGGGVAVIEILKYNLGTMGEFLSAGIAIAMAFCGLSSVASAGRMLYAFSRDDGMPASGWLKKVSHRYRTPINSLTAIVVVSWLFTVAAGYVGGGTAIVIVTAISTIFLYAAYGVVIYLGYVTSDWRAERVWSLGAWSKPIALIAIFWVLVLMVLFSWPTSGNISWPFMIVTVVALLVYFYAWARNRFRGPHAMGGEQELSEIEREFDHAAQELGEAPA
jgi:amino acid transporter